LNASQRGKELGRFLLAGIANTAFSYLLYLVFLQVLKANIAYGLSFVIGVVSAHYLQRRFVFKAQSSKLTWALFLGSYALQFAAGSAIVYGIVHVLRLPAEMAPFPAMAFNFVLSYLLNRMIFLGRS
jgi:putative flippase GtrA